MSFVSDEFSNHVAALQADAGATAAAVESGGQRAWAAPPRGGWDGNPLDPEGMTLAFSRAAIGQAFEAVVGDPAGGGTTGDAIALALQNDYLAARERAFRVRHLSGVRAACHAAARRAGHAGPGGVFGNGVLRYVQDVLRQGGKQS